MQLRIQYENEIQQLTETKAAQEARILMLEPMLWSIWRWCSIGTGFAQTSGMCDRSSRIQRQFGHSLVRIWTCWPHAKKRKRSLEGLKKKKKFAVTKGNPEVMSTWKVDVLA